MIKAVPDKIVVITRMTALEELIERLNSREQARFYIEHMGAQNKTMRRDTCDTLTGSKIGIVVDQFAGSDNSYETTNIHQGGSGGYSRCGSFPRSRIRRY